MRVLLPLLGGCPHGLMRLEEAAHPVDRPFLQFRRLPPWKNRDLGVRRQRGNIDRGLERVRRRVVGQHEDRRTAVADEIARHAVQEIGPHPVEVVKILLDRFHRHVGPAGAEIGGPILVPVPVHDIRVLGPVADALTKHGGDDTLGRAFEELPGKTAADAETHIEELAVAGRALSPSWSPAKAPHGSSTGIGPLDSPPLALRWSIVMQRKSFLNASMALNTAVGQLLTREFSPPPGVTKSGKPEPASS